MSNLPLGAEFDSNAPYNSDEINCPMCGNDMSEVANASGKYKWTNFHCAECGHIVNNEPDWDEMYEERRSRR